MVMKTEERFRLMRAFFGLSEEYMESVYNQFFFLMYHAGLSLIECYNLPVGLRGWFIQKIKDQYQFEKDLSEGNLT